MIISNSVIFLASDLPRNSSEPESPGPVSPASVIAQRPAGEDLPLKALSEPPLFLCVLSCWKGETKFRPSSSSYPLPVPPCFSVLCLNPGVPLELSPTKGIFLTVVGFSFEEQRSLPISLLLLWKIVGFAWVLGGLRVERSLAFASHRAPSSWGCNPRASA